MKNRTVNMRSAGVVVSIIAAALTVGAASGGALRSSYYYTWGIDSDDLNISDGSIITEAVLRIEGITNWDNKLHIHVVDNPPLGFVSNVDSSSEDFFDGFGGLLTGSSYSLSGGDIVITLGGINDTDSWVWDVYQSPVNFQLADSSTVSYSSALLELIDYAGNGTPFGFGFDPAGNEYYYTKMTLGLTVRSYEGAVSQKTISLEPSWSTSGVPYMEVNKAKYAAGEAIVAGYHNAEENGGVWMGLYRKGASDGAYLAWARTDKLADGSSTFTGLTEGGNYEIRLFFNNAFDCRATTQFAVEAAPVLTTGKSSYSVGESVVVNHSGAEANGSVWIALYKKGAADSTYLTWVRTNRLAVGSVTFAGLAEAGTYEARMFFNNNYTLKAIVEFAVTGPAPVPALSTSKSSYSVGESIVVNHTNAETNGGVWIALYKKGAADSAYLTWVRTNKLANGSITFVGLATGGTYEARMFFNNDYTLKATAEFTVQGSPALTAGKSSYSIGESIVISHTNADANGGAWIALYRAGAADAAYLTWSRTNKLANGSVTFTGLTETGAYEARMFFNNVFDKRAVCAFQVN